MRLGIGSLPLIHYPIGLQEVLVFQYPEFRDALGRRDIALSDGEGLVSHHAGDGCFFQHGFQQLENALIGNRVCTEHSFHNSHYNPRHRGCPCGFMEGLDGRGKFVVAGFPGKVGMM